jgi:hypothetical protein
MKNCTAMFTINWQAGLFAFRLIYGYLSFNISCLEVEVLQAQKKKATVTNFQILS